MEQKIKWHYIKEEGMPTVEGNKPKVFLVAYRQELVDLVCTINNKPFYEPNGKYVNVTQNVYAWTEFPEAPEYT